jgi:hypothetical protein
MILFTAEAQRKVKKKGMMQVTCIDIEGNLYHYYAPVSSKADFLCVLYLAVN